MSELQESLNLLSYETDLNYYKEKLIIVNKQINLSTSEKNSKQLLMKRLEIEQLIAYTMNKIDKIKSRFKRDEDKK